MLVATALAVALNAACEKPAAVAPPPPPEVYVRAVVQQDVPVYLDLVGQTQGFQDVEIRARVEGFLDTVNFREGSFVRKGDLLYQIDRKPLEATLAQAAQGRRGRPPRRDSKRPTTTSPGTRRSSPSRRSASRNWTMRVARAGRGRRSQVEAAKAAVDKATLDLGYTRITAPISGLVGTTLVKPGNLVGRGESTLLTTISAIDPIIFRVAVTEADYLRIIKRDPTRAGAGSRAQSGIQLTLADGTVHPHTGTVGPVDRAVNAPPARWACSSLSQSRLRPAAGPVRAGAAAPRHQGRARCSCRSAPCRNCRTCTASRWSAPTTRLRSVT